MPGLISLLPNDKYKIFISGGNKERVILTDWINTLTSNVIDILGKLTLNELISFIN